MGDRFVSWRRDLWVSSQRKGSFKISLANGLWRPYSGSVAEAAPNDRTIQCATRLGALDVPRSLGTQSQGVKVFSVSQDSKVVSLII